MAAEGVHQPDVEVPEDAALLEESRIAKPGLHVRQSHVLALWACSVVATAVAAVLSEPAAVARAPSAAKAIQGKSLMPRGWSDTWKTFWPQLWDESLVDAKFIDLTHSIRVDIPTRPGFGGISLGAGKAGSDVSPLASEGDKFQYSQQGFVTTRYNFTNDQLGTQLRVPAHWNEYGATISDIPATYSVRPLVVIDVSSKVQDDMEYEVTLDDIDQWESDYGRIPSRSVVFIRTDWSKDWEQYRNSGAPPAFPGVGLEALQFLHQQRQILFHGHEPLQTDASPRKEAEAWLMHNHYAQAEGVTNLDKVPRHGCLVAFGFAKLRGGTGGLASFAAVCPSDGNHGTTIAETPGAPLEQQTYPLRRRHDEGVLVATPGVEDSEYCLGAAALGCLDGSPTWVQGLPA